MLLAMIKANTAARRRSHETNTAAGRRSRETHIGERMFEHEKLYRGDAALDQVRDFHVTIAGVGALGSNLADSLSRQGFANLRLIDFDRVEPKNLGTQIYSTEDVGMLKVDAARNAIFRNVEVEPDTICLLYTSPSPRDLSTSRMPSSA